MMSSRSMLICNNKNYSFIYQNWHYLHGALGISVCNKYRSTAALYRSVGKLIDFFLANICIFSRCGVLHFALFYYNRHVLVCVCVTYMYVYLCEM